MKENIETYPLIENISKLVNEGKPVDESIDAVLAELGQKFGLSYIAVKEIALNERVVICTYEWDRDGVKELLHCENRYLDEQYWKYWMHGFQNSEHIWTWDKNCGLPCPARILRNDIAASLLQIPFYRNNEFAGCVDFVDDKPGRVWKNEEIVFLRQFATILGQYLFTIREITEYSSDIMTELYDRTTRLPKYEYFCREIESNLAQLSNCQLVILSMDFTNFKYVNEKYGHQEGNFFLETIARDIYKKDKWVISCCRSHSDNFLILSKCEKIYTKTRIRLTIETFAEEEERKLAEKYFDCNLKINMGIHIIRSDNENIEQAISNANLARKFAKQERQLSGHTCLLYEPMMSYRLKQNAEYIATMSKGIENGEFFIEYQPLVKTESLDIIACEAVVRWKRENVYKLMPLDFVPIFEKDGCIIKMDYYVCEQVFKTLYERVAAGKKVVPVSVNINIVNFYDDKLVDQIDRLLEKYPVSPELISFEMDERVYVKKLDNVSSFIRKMHERGFKVYIDNFGNGYSSLNTLTSFDVDGIKIDRSFVNGNIETKDRVIIECVINMAQKLGMNVVTKGIESEEQRSFLLNVGGSVMQGNYFSGPVSEEKLDTMIGEQII